MWNDSTGRDELDSKGVGGYLYAHQAAIIQRRLLENLDEIECQLLQDKAHVGVLSMTNQLYDVYNHIMPT